MNYQKDFISQLFKQYPSTNTWGWCKDLLKKKYEMAKNTENFTKFDPISTSFDIPIRWSLEIIADDKKNSLINRNKNKKKVLFLLIEEEKRHFSSHKENFASFGELLEKMAISIQLDKKDFVIFIIPQEKILEVVSLYQPEKILAFGIRTTHFLLGHDENTGPRMMNIHGQVFVKQFPTLIAEQLFETQIIPLFHPEFIINNLEMKKNTWLDLKQHFL